MALTDDTQRERGNALTRLLERLVAQGLGRIGAYVDNLRDKNPGVDTKTLALKIVHRRSLKGGLVGAATGFGGFITMAIAVPLGTIIAWKIDVSTILAIACVYGKTTETNSLLADVYLILARDSKIEGFREIGTAVARGVAAKDIRKCVTREDMVRISKRLIKRKAKPTFSKVLRAVPLLGAPVGFVADWRAARAVGRTAIRYYERTGETS